ncbi:hypothetical protein FB451DRAFT_1418344 [Mycena latifolia]|nr:hypothetical protein FB451DRAFT_1418344 [Mycena latifolia]
MTTTGRLRLQQIATAAILAIWLVSADTQLVKVGDETTIDNSFRHCLYVCRIREGLRHKKTWAIGLLKYWDHILFPNVDKSRDHAMAGDDLLEDEESSMIFSLKHPRPSSTLLLPKYILTLQTSCHPSSDFMHAHSSPQDDEDNRNHQTSSPTPHSPPPHSWCSSLTAAPALIVSEIVEPITPCTLSAEYCSFRPRRDTPTCATRGHKGEILHPAECSSAQRLAWTVNIYIEVTMYQWDIIDLNATHGMSLPELI